MLKICIEATLLSKNRLGRKLIKRLKTIEELVTIKARGSRARLAASDTEFSQCTLAIEYENPLVIAE